MGTGKKSNLSKDKTSTRKSTGSGKEISPKAKTKKEEELEEREKIAESYQKILDKTTSIPYEIACKVFISARIFCAMYSTITDCDETYNYWEPSHFLLYGKGFQTWEYSPIYALRSYTYLMLHVVPALAYVKLANPNPLVIFYSIRCVLALICAYSECVFFKAVAKEFGINSGRMVVVFLFFSAGMFNACVSFLPSSFSMYLSFLTTTAWIYKKYESAIFLVALSTFISWPFAALLGVPIAFDILFIKRNYKMFIQWSIISTVVILLPIIKMDSDLYGKLVITPLNIVLYNVFSNHGPNLYGTEPPYFYFINGFLNFNIAFIAAIIAPIVLVLRNILMTDPEKRISFRCWLIMTPFYVWFTVFSLQPHKEERFLYPVYPLICLCGAVCIDSIQLILSTIITKYFSRASKFLTRTSWVCIIAVAIYILLGLSRIAAVYRGYHAPMDLWTELSNFRAEVKFPPRTQIYVCLGKEWHRFPSSFFLPTGNWHVKFLESEFKGQLPAEYSEHPNATALIHSHFNDLNQEERSRYFDVEKCHFIVDCDFGKETKLEPNYSKQTNKWMTVFSLPFLDAANSNPFFRAFYIPYLTKEYCSYGNYNLLQSTKYPLIKSYPGKQLYS